MSLRPKPTKPCPNCGALRVMAYVDYRGWVTLECRACFFSWLPAHCLPSLDAEVAEFRAYFRGLGLDPLMSRMG